MVVQQVPAITTTEIPEVSVSITADDFFGFNESGMLTASSGFSTGLWSNNETTEAIDVTVNEGTYCLSLLQTTTAAWVKLAIGLVNMQKSSVDITGNLEFL